MVIQIVGEFLIINLDVVRQTINVNKDLILGFIGIILIAIWYYKLGRYKI